MNGELEATEAGRKALALRRHVEEVKSWCRDDRMHPKAVCQFYRVEAEGDRILLHDGAGTKISEIQFPRRTDRLDFA